MALLHAISIAAELSVHGMCTQMHTGGASGVRAQVQPFLQPPWVRNAAWRVTHTQKSWPGFGIFFAFIIFRMQWLCASLGAEKKDGVILYSPLFQCYQGHTWNKT